MSVKLMGQVWGLKVSRPWRDLLLALADHADDHGYCRPGVDYLAWKTDYAPRSVQRILRELETGRLIEATAHARGGRGKATVYRLYLERAERKDPYRPDRLTAAMRAEVIERDGYACAYCKEPGTEEAGPDGQPWHIDRIIPRARGGRYEDANVALACATCDRRKGARLAPFDDERAPEQHPSADRKGAIPDQKGATAMAPQPKENRNHSGTGSGVPSPPGATMSADEPPTRPDVEELCSLLADLIVGNGGSPAKYLPRVTTKAWTEPMRLLLDKDLAVDHHGEPVPPEQRVEKAGKAIRWAQEDDFWRGNILSPGKLREQYDALRLAAQRNGSNGGVHSNGQDRDRDREVAATQARLAADADTPRSRRIAELSAAQAATRGSP